MMLLQPTPSLSGHPMKLCSSWDPAGNHFCDLLGTMVALRGLRLS